MLGILLISVALVLAVFLALWHAARSSSPRDDLVEHYLLDRNRTRPSAKVADSRTVPNA